MLGRLASRLAQRVANAAAELQRADARWSPALKVALRQLWLDHRARAEREDTLPPASATGFRIFSQFEEDGIILFLLASLGDGPAFFLDLGAGDGVYASNCANLAVNSGSTACSWRPILRSWPAASASTRRTPTRRCIRRRSTARA